MGLTTSERSGNGERQWPLYILELREGAAPMLHRQTCDRWQRPSTDVGGFATARSAWRIARLDAKRDVAPCPRCCACLVSRL